MNAAACTPTPATLAIVEFRAANGRTWKRRLLALWQSGRDSGDLRLARNVIGPSGLIGF